MHPGFHAWWHMGRAMAARARGEHHAWCGAAGDGFGGGTPDDLRSFAHSGGDFGAGLGVRRPLRFLAWKLELEEQQIEQLAPIIEELKTERAQAELDFRRSTTSIADAVSQTELDSAKLSAASEQRVASEQRKQQAVVRAVERMHALLDTEQKKKLAYLLRTGALQL
jgi:Spy/CpxP family protein refolding chaperone